MQPRHPYQIKKKPPRNMNMHGNGGGHHLGITTVVERGKYGKARKKHGA